MSGPSASPMRFKAAWNTEQAYGWVLMLLLLDLSLLITMPSTDWARAIQVLFVALTLLLALRTSAVPRRVMRFGEIGALVTVIVSVTIAVLDLPSGGGAVYLIMAALLLVTSFAMLRVLLTQSEVTGRILLGALSVYLMIGLFFSFLFLAIAVFDDGVFFAQGPTVNPSDFVYFSYVTMLTIGYGDLSPGTNLGRMLSVMDGLIGQVFLVTTIARLVSMFGGRSGLPRGEDRPD